MARALLEAATWVGCDNIALEVIKPAGVEARLRAGLAAAV
jgi:hypothetical protein